MMMNTQKKSKAWMQSRVFRLHASSKDNSVEKEEEIFARDNSKRRETKKTQNRSSNDKKEEIKEPSKSLEDLLGLRSDQLRDLMEQELPVPREDLIKRKEVQQEKEEKNDDKVFRLPDLIDFNKETKDGDISLEKQRQEEKDKIPRVDRNNPDEFMRVIQLNPFADADETLFVEEVKKYFIFILGVVCLLIVWFALV